MTLPFPHDTDALKLLLANDPVFKEKVDVSSWTMISKDRTGLTGVASLLSLWQKI